MTGLSNRSGKEGQHMTQLLIQYAHRLFGRLTVLIVWPRKRRR